GGVCLNEGCIPTKTLLYSAKIYDNACHGEKYGVKAENVTFDFGKIVARKNKVVRKLVAGVGSKMKMFHVNVIKGEAYIVGRSEKGIEITCNGESTFARNLLICTGSEAFVPPIPGVKEAGDVILTNREILALKDQPRSLVIIGGGVIGMEFASFYNSLGTEVTVIEMLPEILGVLDAEISAMLRDIYAKKGIKFNLSCKVTAVNGNEVEYEDPTGAKYTIIGEKILMSVGRRPVTQGFGLENLGVELNRGGIKVDEKMRTNIPNVFAAGDVTGFSMLAHTASREGEVVVNNLTGRNDMMRYNAIPGVVYTNPEVSCVGLTEEQAAKEGIAYKVAKLPMAFAGRFVAENEGGNGLCKVLVGVKHGEVLGVHMLGNPSSEMLYGACMAIEQEMTVKELEEVVFPHPTVSEIFKEAIFSL
ncbi:MAG: dihydrolipoyl dehydrogenase, partial [Bacteroidales bacterium]